MKRSFDIITDTCNGMPDDIIKANSVTVLPLGYTLGGKTYGGNEGTLLSPQEFYDDLRKGYDCHTFQVTADQAAPVIEASFLQGRDVLIVSFSSALSGTASSFSVAANALTEKYPDRKAYVLDSLGGSMGEGLLIEYLAKKAETGATIEEVYNYGQSLKLKINHLFTVDDLGFLKRGGRIPAALAALGKLLKIKPILQANASGFLSSLTKTLGRKKSLEILAEETEKRAELADDDPICIAHADCLEDAMQLKELLRARLGKTHKFIVNYIDQVMGAHSGPGALAVFFKGKVRQ